MNILTRIVVYPRCSQFFRRLILHNKMLFNNFRLGLQRMGQAANIAKQACTHEHAHANMHIQPSFLTTMSRTYKIRTAVKKFCADCYIARRKGRVYVLCKSNAKHKQKQA